MTVTSDQFSFCVRPENGNDTRPIYITKVYHPRPTPIPTRTSGDDSSQPEVSLRPRVPRVWQLLNPLVLLRGFAASAYGRTAARSPLNSARNDLEPP